MAIKAETCPQCGGSIPHGYGNQLTCQYCGSSLVRLNQTAQQIPGGPPQVSGSDHDAAASMWGVRMKRATHTDLKSGLVAFQFLIPAEWEFQGDIWWRDSATLPAIPSFRAWNPNGPEQIEWLPTIPCIWHKNILTEAFSKLGKNSHFFKEDGIESRAPMTSQEVLKSLVVPRYRGPLEGSEQVEKPKSDSQTKSSMWDFSGGLTNYFSKDKIRERMEKSKGLLKQIPGLESATKGLKNLISPRYKPYGVNVRITAEESLPKLALSLSGGQEDVFNPLSSDGSRIRINYNLDGKQMDEDIFCVVSKVVTQTGTKLSKQENIFWVAEALYAFRASAGNLDAVGQACMASVKSFKMNPRWLQACQMESRRIIKEREMIAKMMQQMAADQRRSLQRIGDLSRSISEAGDSIMDGYWARSAAQDRMHDNWTEAFRGVQSYNDPSSDYSPQLPGGYDHAWGNGLGEYIVANDSSFNPNLYSNMNWQELQRRT
ncbi:MAG: hypothetical protein JW715_08475 [Sedimentisphaerales bacterium]|nr:hypothetical protein [Sedimentisphaerales bacterium]